MPWDRLCQRLRALVRGSWFKGRCGARPRWDLSRSARLAISLSAGALIGCASVGNVRPLVRVEAPRSREREVAFETPKYGTAAVDWYRTHDATLQIGIRGEF